VDTLACHNIPTRSVRSQRLARRLWDAAEGGTTVRDVDPPEVGIFDLPGEPAVARRRAGASWAFGVPMPSPDGRSPP